LALASDGEQFYAVGEIFGFPRGKKFLLFVTEYESVARFRQRRRNLAKFHYFLSNKHGFSAYFADKEA